MSCEDLKELRYRLEIGAHTELDILALRIILTKLIREQDK